MLRGASRPSALAARARRARAGALTPPARPLRPPQIRAANLSGDCWLSREVARGNLTLAKGHQECVKRRAALSVAMNPNCSAPGQAKAAVKRQFDQCFADTAPFDRVPS